LPAVAALLVGFAAAAVAAVRATLALAPADFVAAVITAVVFAAADFAAPGLPALDLATEDFDAAVFTADRPPPTVLAATVLAATVLAASVLEATAGLRVAAALLGEAGLGTVGRVVVVVRTVAVVAFRAAAAATFLPAGLGAGEATTARPVFFPAPAVALVGAFLAAAIRVFLLANDCGLVSAWRLRIPAWTQGVARRC
jgi:hypothetical protein